MYNFQWLRTNHDHAYQAVMWLRSNKQLLSGVVYEPMIIEVSNTMKKFILKLFVGT